MAHDISDDLKVYLKTKSVITSVIGSGTAARIYNHHPKQGVPLPYIVLEVFEGISHESLNSIVGVAVNRVQVDAYATTAAGAFDLAERIRRAPLQMYRGTFGASTVLGIQSQSSYRRGYDEPMAGGGDTARFWCSRDYMIWYREDTAVYV